MPAGYGYNYPVSRGFSLARVYEVVALLASREKPCRRETFTRRLILLISNKMCNYVYAIINVIFLQKYMVMGS